MILSFQFDPCEILGVASSASLLEIRDAYRARSKTYHPDAGGDSWAFRVLARSYEVLSQARVATRATEEERRREPTPGSAPGRPDGAGPKPRGDEAGPRVVADPVADPSLLVAVEALVIRFEESDPLLFLLRPAEERNLSCTLQVGWPISALVARLGPIPDREGRLADVAAAFESIKGSAHALAERSCVEDGRFGGWLTFPSFLLADAAMRRFRAALKSRGMGVQQTIREHFVPREWAG